MTANLIKEAIKSAGSAGGLLVMALTSISS